MPSAALPAKSESPKTTTRVSGFAASAAPAGAAADVDTAAATVTGPCLSLPAVNATLPVVSSPLMSDSAQLRGLVSTKPCAVWPLTPPVTGVTERADGYAVSSRNRCVIACAGYVAATGTDASVP